MSYLYRPFLLAIISSLSFVKFDRRYRAVAPIDISVIRLK